MTVTTASAPDTAKTDGNVYLTMIGAAGRCHEARLDTPADNFELGAYDLFLLEVSILFISFLETIK